MSDLKRITAIVEDAKGNRKTVSLNEREKWNEVIEPWEMLAGLRLACEKQGLTIVEILNCDYVSVSEVTEAGL